MEIKNLPDNQKGNLSVSIRKKQSDRFFDDSCRLTIFSECGVKKVASFQCEPCGDLIVTVISNPSSKFSVTKQRTIGKSVLSLADLVDLDSNLSIDKWFELKTRSGNADSKPIYLRITASFTVPVPAPHLLYMAGSHTFSVGFCFTLHINLQLTRRWACFLDENGNEIISMQMRYTHITMVSMEKMMSSQHENSFMLHDKF